METSQPSSFDPPAAAADYPRWVIFAGQKHYRHKAGLCSSPADGRTVAHARTSAGLSVRASFRFAAPPAVSRLDLDLDLGHGLPDGVDIIPSVVVAHGDSVLIHMRLYKAYEIDTTDYFVYHAGDGARPPSLSLLPACYMDLVSHDGRRYQLTMSRKGTGILRRSDGEFVVATDLNMDIIAQDDDGGGAKRVEAEVRVLRSSEWQWNVERLPVCHDVNKGEVISYCWWWEWVTDWVIPVGDRFFYWVDLHQGIVFADMSGENPDLRFVTLPVEPILRERKDWDRPDSSRSMCATEGGATVKFVHVFPRCCCGGPGATKCELSRYSFTVITWTLRTTTAQVGDMVWEMDAVVDCGDLWALDSYRLLPRLPMDYPVVSIDNTDAVCFLVSEHKHLRSDDGDKTTWVVMVDTRTKTLLRSAIFYSKDEYYNGEALLPSQVSSYFNTSPGPGSSNHSAPPSNERRRLEDIADVSPAAKCLPSPDEEILAALQEIPELTRDEMLRAYGVLACDDRRRYRSLVALPMNMRKEYCCMLVDMGTNKCSSCAARLAAATGAL